MYAGSDSMAPMFRTLILTLVSAAVMSAQTSTASVSGTVRDQTAAVIPAANVVLSNADTGLSWRTSTNVAGVYIFPAVPPGAYRLTVKFAGMQKYEATLTVQVQQNAVIDPTLTPGQATTTVEVRDVTPVVTVDSPTRPGPQERSVSIQAIIENCVLVEDDIAFRCRGTLGSAWVTARDNTVYQTSRVFRLEHNVKNVKIHGLALGEGIGQIF